MVNAPRAAAVSARNARIIKAVTVRNALIRAATQVIFQPMPHARFAAPALFPPARFTRAAQAQNAITDRIPTLVHMNGK